MIYISNKIRNKRQHALNGNGGLFGDFLGNVLGPLGGIAGSFLGPVGGIVGGGIGSGLGSLAKNIPFKKGGVIGKRKGRMTKGSKQAKAYMAKLRRMR